MSFFALHNSTRRDRQHHRLKYDQVLGQLVSIVRIINNKKEKKMLKQIRMSPPNGTFFTSCDVTALVGYDYTFLCTFTYVSNDETKFWKTEFTTSVLYMRGTFESCKNTFLATIPECYRISPDSVNLEIERI